MKYSVDFLYNFVTRFARSNSSKGAQTWKWSNMNSEGYVNVVPAIAEYALAAKYRVGYYVVNWIYTTNHKRIAVNYFWFVIFSGICGMVLATIIRLEMAYPGVGILAGDSLQYLSVVTAHAVVMVFFMIMPLLFGAFGNFLLPTQLGVHDVAFPRLNSAAFWFLPAGLLMLVQLICLDRRYQRMNCYNIREIQTLLKSKYTPNTVDNADVRFSLEDTSLGLRYYSNGIEYADPSIFVFYKNALTTSPRYQTSYDFASSYFLTSSSSKLLMSTSSPMYASLAEVSGLNAEGPFSYRSRSVFTSLEIALVDALRPVVRPTAFTLRNLFETCVEYALVTLSSVTAPFTSPFGVAHELFSSAKALTSGSYFFSLGDLFAFEMSVKLPLLSASHVPSVSAARQIGYDSAALTQDSLNTLSESSMQENALNYRYLRLQNPVFKYDFKLGNYLPDTAKLLSSHLFTTVNDVTAGVRRSSWFTSFEFKQAFNLNLYLYFMHFSANFDNNPIRSGYADKYNAIDRKFTVNDPYSSNASFTHAFYNFFNVMNSSSNLINSRYVALDSLNQKFYRMFATASMQQRIFANWRQLKFTREAWRCKLLAARHQNTLYRRYLNEDSVVWAVERNAKDVLPGWAMITPFSARTRYTAIGKVDIGLMGVFLVLNSSIVSSANFLVTYRYLSTLNNRKMRDARSFFTEGVMVASWMMIAANPMLAIGILMLLSDRHWQTSFFDYSGGGDTVLFQHMFWFFGHPEVYVIMIPAFGFNNTILSFYLRKRVSARASLLYSMYTIAFLGFFVWGHHMYMVGLAHTTRMLFSTLTVMISVPAATKLMHWCVTIVNSSFTVELPLIFQLLFIFFFVSGGISGMAVAHTGMDILFHDSFYVVGHFHVMLAGSAMFASFGAFYFYFPAIFGVRFSRIYGYLHCIYYLIGQLMTVVPMFWLGYAAMPRRVLDYPATMGGWHAIVSAGHMLSVAGMMAFFIMIFDSLRQGRAVTRNWFGVARFNTRINFYIYEGARTWYLQRRGWHIARFNVHNSVPKNGLNYFNYEFFETTLFSYVIVKK